MENENIENKQVEQSKDNSKKKKILKYVLNGVVWGLIVGFLIYSGLKVIDVKTGYNLLPTHSAVIVSDSMSFVNEANYSYLDKDVDHIKKNDVVHTVNYDSFDEVKPVQDVVLYLSDSGILICHRVIDKYVNDGIQYIVTRGDANNSDDAPVRFDLVRGRVNSVTGGGGAVLFFQSPYFVLALCGTGFFILLGYIIFNSKAEKKAAGIDGPVEKVEEKPEEEVKQELLKVEAKVEEQSAAEEKPVKEPEPIKEEPKVKKQPKVEDKEKTTRVNGRFVSKNSAPAKKSTRWTKENNPTVNKKRAEGGNK